MCTGEARPACEFFFLSVYVYAQWLPLSPPPNSHSCFCFKAIVPIFFLRETSKKKKTKQNKTGPKEKKKPNNAKNRRKKAPSEKKTQAELLSVSQISMDVLYMVGCPSPGIPPVHTRSSHQKYTVHEKALYFKPTFFFPITPPPPPPPPITTRRRHAMPPQKPLLHYDQVGGFVEAMHITAKGARNDTGVRVARNGKVTGVVRGSRGEGAGVAHLMRVVGVNCSSVADGSAPLSCMLNNSTRAPVAIATHTQVPERLILIFNEDTLLQCTLPRHHTAFEGMPLYISSSLRLSCHFSHERRAWLLVVHDDISTVLHAHRIIPTLQSVVRPVSPGAGAGIAHIVADSTPFLAMQASPIPHYCSWGVASGVLDRIEVNGGASVIVKAISSIRVVSKYARSSTPPINTPSADSVVHSTPEAVDYTTLFNHSVEVLDAVHATDVHPDGLPQTISGSQSKRRRNEREKGYAVGPFPHLNRLLSGGSPKAVIPADTAKYQQRWKLRDDGSDNRFFTEAFRSCFAEGASSPEAIKTTAVMEGADFDPLALCISSYAGRQRGLTLLYEVVAERREDAPNLATLLEGGLCITCGSPQRKVRRSPRRLPSPKPFLSSFEKEDVMPRKSLGKGERGVSRNAPKFASQQMSTLRCVTAPAPSRYPLLGFLRHRRARLKEWDVRSKPSPHTKHREYASTTLTLPAPTLLALPPPPVSHPLTVPHPPLETLKTKRVRKKRTNSWEEWDGLEVMQVLSRLRGVVRASKVQQNMNSGHVKGVVQRLRDEAERELLWRTYLPWQKRAGVAVRDARNKAEVLESIMVLSGLRYQQGLFQMWQTFALSRIFCREGRIVLGRIYFLRWSRFLDVHKKDRANHRFETTMAIMSGRAGNCLVGRRFDLWRLWVMQQREAAVRLRMVHVEGVERSMQFAGSGRRDMEGLELLMSASLVFQKEGSGVLDDLEVIVHQIARQDMLVLRVASFLQYQGTFLSQLMKKSFTALRRYLLLQKQARIWKSPAPRQRRRIKTSKVLLVLSLNNNVLIRRYFMSLRRNAAWNKKIFANAEKLDTYCDCHGLPRIACPTRGEAQ